MSSERNVSRIDNIGGHWFIDQLTGILEKIIEFLPGVWWAASFSSPADHDSVHDAQMQEYILLRHVGPMALLQVYWNQRQAAGSWTEGFIYATGSPPPIKATVAYFTPIHQPFTDIRCGLVVLSCQPRPWIYWSQYSWCRVGGEGTEGGE